MSILTLFTLGALGVGCGRSSTPVKDHRASLRLSRLIRADLYGGGLLIDGKSPLGAQALRVELMSRVLEKRS